jgi:hypothetical protein
MNVFIKIVLNWSDGLLWKFSPQNFFGKKIISCCWALFWCHRPLTRSRNANHYRVIITASSGGTMHIVILEICARSLSHFYWSSHIFRHRFLPHPRSLASCRQSVILVKIPYIYIYSFINFAVRALWIHCARYFTEYKNP